MRRYFAKLFLLIISPIFFTLMIFIVWILYFYFKKQLKNREKLKSYISCSLVIVLFMLHPNLTNACFEAFAFLILFTIISIFLQLKLFLIYRCRDIGDDGVNYLRADLEIECYSSTHINNALSYAVPGLIFYVIVNLSKKKKLCIHPLLIIFT